MSLGLPGGQPEGIVARSGEQRLLVTLENVGKTYQNGTAALAHLSLTITSGEFLTLLGPSGCGKSTILRLIAGLDSATSGRLAWSRPLRRGEIGFVFQDPTLMPWANVFDNVRLPLRLQPAVPRAAQGHRIEEALARVGLEGFETSFPRELSGGMRMRVSIARALISRPSLLLMDEPFAALDEITRFRLNDDLVRLKKELGMTIVFVTHSVFESVFLSTRIAVMTARPGRIIEEIEIDPELPRNEALRTSSLYLETCHRASRSLALSGLGEER
ncbi:MAG: ABC transporter ATP-binding protein [Beijerinckiaceae bacterium]